MNRLIDAFEGLFAEAVEDGGDLARTAKFALDNVDWNGNQGVRKITSHHIVDSHLHTACTNSGLPGSCSNFVAEALLATTDQLEWRASTKARDDAPDISLLLRNFAVTTVIGEGGLLASDKITAGFSLQSCDTYYPPHAHRAEESYWIIGGDADWKVNTKPWFAVEPGDSIYHESEARHAMQTNEQPLLTVWMWTSHLDSEVMIIRG